MERKVIKQGPNTLMISLPIKWAKKNKISKGDTVNILEEQNSLFITKGIPKEEIRRAEVEIKEEYKESLVRAIISNLYKRGYDLIEVNVIGDKAIKKIQKSVNSIMGFEIVEQKEEKIIIKNISKDLDNEFKNYLRRSFYMLIETGRIIYEDLKSNKFDNQENIKQLNQNIKKFTDVCKRSITKNDIYPEKNKFLYLIIWSLEKVSNEYEYIYRRVLTSKIKKEPSLINFIEETNIFVKTFYEFYYKIKKIDLDYFTKKKDELYYSRSYNLLKKSSNPVIVMHLANIIRLTYNMINPLIGIEY
ncbi:hypothetical protein KY343_02415 [Candidatus Woesearchaeota archaeon]|nr:hypothetical protein [Candidatus Woesearchaeota archaeon]